MRRSEGWCGFKPSEETNIHLDREHRGANEFNTWTESSQKLSLFTSIPPRVLLDAILELKLKDVYVFYDIARDLKPISCGKTRTVWEKNLEVLGIYGWEHIHICIHNRLIRFKVLHCLHYWRDKLWTSLSDYWREILSIFPKING